MSELRCSFYKTRDKKKSSYFPLHGPVAHLQTACKWSVSICVEGNAVESQAIVSLYPVGIRRRIKLYGTVGASEFVPTQLHFHSRYDIHLIFYIQILYMRCCFTNFDDVTMLVTHLFT